MNKTTSALDIACFLGTQIEGDDLIVSSPLQLANACPGALVFAKRYDPELWQRLEKVGGVLVIAPLTAMPLPSLTQIRTDNPRLAFARVLEHFFTESLKAGIDPAATVDASARLGRNVYVGPGVTIGPEVMIGDDSVIHANVSIYRDVVIGKRAIIDSGAIIGAEGFGFERDSNGRLIKFPQLGSVEISDDVEIGANVCIDKGTLSPTYIKRGVKIDNMAHISHNSIIGEDTLICTHACICGSVVVGNRCWIGPHVSIRQKLKIGDDVTLGLGSAILRNVRNGQIVIGNPAVDLKKFGDFALALRTRSFLGLQKR